MFTPASTTLGPRALTAAVTGVAAVSHETRLEMFALYERHYLATSFAQFQTDLDAKDSVFLLHDDNGDVCGFSTIVVWDAVACGERVRVVFSGDTIIDPAFWGTQTFAFTWLRHVGAIAAARPATPLFWLLMVKGHRTYRYLPAFGLHFEPDWRGREDGRLVALKHDIASQYFGPAYDPSTGTVSFDRSRGHLTPALAAPTPREAEREDVRFFLQRNPGFVHGTELVCLCELEAANMRPLARRLFLQGHVPQGHGRCVGRCAAGSPCWRPLRRRCRSFAPRSMTPRVRRHAGCLLSSHATIKQPSDAATVSTGSGR